MSDANIKLTWQNKLERKAFFFLQWCDDDDDDGGVLKHPFRPRLWQRQCWSVEDNTWSKQLRLSDICDEDKLQSLINCDRITSDYQSLPLQVALSRCRPTLCRSNTNMCTRLCSRESMGVAYKSFPVVAIPVHLIIFRGIFCGPAYVSKYIYRCGFYTSTKKLQLKWNLKCLSKSNCLDVM